MCFSTKTFSNILAKNMIHKSNLENAIEKNRFVSLQKASKSVTIRKKVKDLYVGKSGWPAEIV